RLVRLVVELHILEGDVTADGKPDAVAWMRSADGTAGELVQFASARDDGPLRPRTLVPLPADLTLGEACKAEADLRQVGPRTLALSYRRTCKKGANDVVTLWKAVVVPVRDPAVRLTFVIDQPSGPSHLEVALDALDRDGDQFDDLFAMVRLEGEPKIFGEPDAGEVRVSLHYFDRPAGLSRDPHEPAASFTELARKLDRDADGERRKTVPAAARQVRRIHRMLCAEAGYPRVQMGGGPLQCGATDALHRVTRAELDATLGLDRLVDAFGAYDRLQAQGASAKDTDAARKALERAAPRREAESYFLPFGPSSDPEHARWGALAFDEEGALLIRTDASVMRFDPKTRVAMPDPESGPVAPWPLAVDASGGAMVLESVFDPCDGSLLQARIRRGGASSSVPLPVDPLSTRGCWALDSRFVAVRPVAWTNDGLALVLESAALWIANDGSSEGSKIEHRPITDAKGPKGSPKSPDGKFFVHPSSLGLLVMGPGDKATLWRSEAMASGYDRLTACTASNGASAVACIDGSRTRVFVPAGK
ncbi:MAG: hypothetical protein ACOC1F_13490, partial [Myxococcota bacterium]